MSVTADMIVQLVQSYGLELVFLLSVVEGPIVTVIGLSLAALISGVVITETVFAIPGIGRLTVDGIFTRDYPVVQGVVLFFSFVYVFLNLAVDVIYALVDPRIRY